MTDGLPPTLAHPRDEGLETNKLGTNFFFEIDLGRVASLDHVSLRTRGDGYTQPETDQQLLLEQLGWRLPAQPLPKITAKREVQM